MLKKISLSVIVSIVCLFIIFLLALTIPHPYRGTWVTKTQNFLANYGIILPSKIFKIDGTTEVPENIASSKVRERFMYEAHGSVLSSTKISNGVYKLEVKLESGQKIIVPLREDYSLIMWDRKSIQEDKVFVDAIINSTSDTAKFLNVLDGFKYITKDDKVTLVWNLLDDKSVVMKDDIYFNEIINSLSPKKIYAVRWNLSQ